jgi:hypothetical protein
MFIALKRSIELKLRRSGIAAPPPDVRKGFAFPRENFGNLTRGYASRREWGGIASKETKLDVTERQSLSAHQAAQPLYLKQTKPKGEKIMTIQKTLAALVVATILATLIAFTGTRSNVSAGGGSAPDLEGSWEITVTPDGGDPIVDLATFTRGGGVINSDPDPNLSTGHGAWVRTGGDEFAVTFVHFLSSGGVPLGRLKVRAVQQLDKQTDTFSGKFQTDVIIGGNVVQTICGTVTATRISVETPECP